VEVNETDLNLLNEEIIPNTLNGLDNEIIHSGKNQREMQADFHGREGRQNLRGGNNRPNKM
jgi:hypothetical protein